MVTDLPARGSMMMQLTRMTNMLQRTVVVGAFVSLISVGMLSSAWAADGVSAFPTVAGRQTIILLFPVQVGVEGVPEDIVRWATNALQAALDDLPNVVCLDFSRTSPLVRRAVREGRVRSVDVEQGVSEPALAVEIGHAMEADLVVLATLQSYKLTQQPAQVEVVLGGQAYDVKSNFDEQTLEAKPELQVFRAFGVVGKSKARPKYKGPEGVLAREALRDAAFRAAQVIAGVPAEAIGKAPAKHKRHKAWRWFLIAAGVAALVAVINNSTESRAAPVTGNEYRPRRLTAIAQPAGQNSILVTWDPPIRTENLMGYELQRSFRAPASPTPSPFVTIAGLPQLPAGTTQWLDHGLNSDYVYMYRLRARYSDRTPTSQDWISTGWVGFSGS